MVGDVPLENTRGSRGEKMLNGREERLTIRGVNGN
jgi:hypothetical protein